MKKADSAPNCFLHSILSRPRSRVPTSSKFDDLALRLAQLRSYLFGDRYGAGKKGRHLIGSG